MVLEAELADRMNVEKLLNVIEQVENFLFNLINNNVEKINKIYRIIHQ